MNDKRRWLCFEQGARAELTAARVIASETIKAMRRTRMATRFTRQWTLAVVWTLSLLVVGAASFSAQGRGGVPRLSSSLITEGPTLISGNDIGFRIERTKDFA